MDDTLPRREVVFERKLFEFESLERWVQKGQSWYAKSGVASYRTIALDARGRVVASGGDFGRAKRESAYPVTVYEITRVRESREGT